jgi:solute:Na+ symporter, SSS family
LAAIRWTLCGIDVNLADYDDHLPYNIFLVGTIWRPCSRLGHILTRIVCIKRQRRSHQADTKENDIVNLSFIDKGVFVLYLLIVLAVGFYAARKAVNTKRDYYLAGDKLSWWLIGGSIVAANISSHHFIGVMGVAYKRGFVAMAIEWPAIIITFNALLWIFLPYYLRNGFYTVPEYLQHRYGKGARTAYAVLILIAYIFIEISAVLYMGALAINALLGIQLWYGIVGLAILVGAYTITGGLRAVVWTEMLQLGILLIGGLVLSFTTIHAVGGWSGVMATSKDWHLIMPASDPDFPWTMFIGASLSVGVFYGATNQFIVQRVLAAKNEWHARMGVVFADYLKFFLPLIIIVPGLVAPILFPGLERPDLIFPTLVKNLLPTGLVGLVMSGLIAAAMSHISGALNAGTTIFCVDVYLPFINRNATETQAVKVGKTAGIIILLLGILWAGMLISYSDKPIFIYLLNAYGYFTPGITTMFLLGIFWKRATSAGALTSAILAIPLSLALDLLLPVFGLPPLSFMNRTGITFWICMLVAIVVSFFTKVASEEQLEGLIWSRQSLSLPQELRAKVLSLKNPVIWWTIINAAVIYMYVRYF